MKFYGIIRKKLNEFLKKVSSHTTIILGYCASIYTSLTVMYYNGGDNKMTTIQRFESDMATIERRETADKTLSDSRNRNDILTQERRFNVDKIRGEKRLRNDEMTANRRETKDGIILTA